MMDNSEFYASLRKRNSGVFGDSLSQRQVDGTDALLDAANGLPLDHLAHVMGEVYHETGGGMYPVKETVFPYSRDKNPSDATVIARLDRAWAKGQLPWVKSPYWRGGAFGRGQLQVTHEENYRKCSALTGVDQVTDKSKALELPVSAANAVEGCRAGIFTGKRLGDFHGPDGFDHVGARAIVNGDKNKREASSNYTNGERVQAYALAFERALKAAGYGSKPTMPQPTPAKPAHGFWAFLLSLFGVRK